jgi:predicted aspartyl protease
MLILGRFDSTDSPTIAIEVAGATGSKSYDAVIDTGFTGFVALPWNEMIHLGLSTQGATDVTLGDGSITHNHLSTGAVTLGSQVEKGTILLDEKSTDILVGMDFLRKFKMALILTNVAVVLYDEHETLEAVAKFMGTAPQGQPNTTPSASS